MERKDETYSLMAYAAGFLQETQRRGQRRCPSKYGILTAKFHLLGAQPLIPRRPEMRLNLRRIFSTHFIKEVTAYGKAL